MSWLKNAQVGLGGTTPSERLAELDTHYICGHEVMFVRTDGQLKVVCKNCGLGREIRDEVMFDAAAKRYLLGEFVEDGQCYPSK